MELNNFVKILVLLLFITVLKVNPQPREVAVTIDDLPFNSLNKDINYCRQLTTGLLDKLTKYKIPATGFVNEGKLFDGNSLVSERLDLLKQWLGRGFELGNHTYSHKSLNSISAKEFTGDLLKGERYTRELMKDEAKDLIYFRHPFLHTGRSPEVRDSLQTFLKNHNYRIAPVTIDNSEWLFARAYEKALMENDSLMMNKVVDAYIPYMESKFEHFEFVSRELFGREIKQILLIHANKINSDHFDKLAEMIIKRDYRFISLEEALKDTAYNALDNYFGRGGISWLHRWALTEKRDKEIFKTDLPVPEFIEEYTGIEE